MSSRVQHLRAIQLRVPSTFEYLALYLLVAFDVLVLLDAVGASVPFLQPLLLMLLVCPVLGGLVLLAIGIQPAFRPRWAAYALGTGLVTFLLTGICLNAALPQVGYDRPLSLVPLLLTLNALVLGLVAFLRSRGVSTTLDPKAVVSRRDLHPVVLFFLSIPFWTILAVTYLNATNDNVPILVVLLSLSIVPLFVVAFGVSERFHPIAILAVAVSILHHKNLWLPDSYGGHTSVVTIYETGLWTFRGESLAVNAVLLPALGRLSGLPILTFISVVYPLIVMFIPLGMYLCFRRYTTPETAFLGATLFAFAHPFYFQYPDSPRSGMPVLFMVLLGLVISDDENRMLHRSLLAVLFGFGIIASHYGTSYYVMFALIGALVVMWCYGTVASLVSLVVAKRAALVELIREPDRSLLEAPDATVLTRSYVGYYVSAVIGYYYFVDDGTVYQILVEHVLSAYVDLFASTDDGGGGATATRLTTDYGGLSIEYSKHLYVLIALLIALGLAVVHWERLVPWRETEFDDDYLAFSSLLLFLFGGTIVLSGEWGGGRPMMIVFSFTAVFAVLGMTWIARTIHRVASRIVAAVRRRPATSSQLVAVAGRGAFAVLLATFFVLNSGTMAALAYGGEAPSQVPNTDLDESTDATDLSAHAFVTDHRSTTETIYGDRSTREAATDWLSGEIDAITERSHYRFQRANDLRTVHNGTELERGYVVLVGHNVVGGMVDVNYVVSRPIEEFDLDLERRHLVFDNGGAELYYTDGTAVAVARNGGADS